MLVGLGGLIHFDEAPQLSVCVLPIEKSQFKEAQKLVFTNRGGAKEKCGETQGLSSKEVLSST